VPLHGILSKVIINLVILHQLWKQKRFILLGKTLWKKHFHISQIHTSSVFFSFLEEAVISIDETSARYGSAHKKAVALSNLLNIK